MTLYGVVFCLLDGVRQIPFKTTASAFTFLFCITVLPPIFGYITEDCKKIKRDASMSVSFVLY